MVDPQQETEAATAAQDGPPTPAFTRRNVIFGAVFVVGMLVALYYFLPQLAGLDKTWRRIEEVSPLWLTLALMFTCASYLGYVVIFQGVFVQPPTRFTWRESYQITMAGLAATRIFSAGGAGGIILTAWALRRSGMSARRISDKTIAFLALTYLVYLSAIIIVGFGLYFGLFPGSAPFALTFLPAVLCVVLMAVALAMTLVPTDFQNRLQGFADGGGRGAKLAQKLANVPASISAGMRDAFEHLRHRNPALLGAVAFWAFQIAVLWASFEAFGESPPLAVLILGFFVGMLGNLLPMPGGIGGVDGGLIAVFAAFGVDVGLAVVAVLVHRAFVFWLPTIPGIIAYFQLRKTVDRWRRAGRGAERTVAA